jgi:pimeloyl-ACP methyl ester carboxylesterase
MLPRSCKRITILTGMLLGWAVTSGAQPDPELVTLTAEDGVQTVSSWYARNDDAPVVILLHNVGTTSGNFRPLIPELYKSGFQILAMDLRGHGRSRDLNPEVYEAMRSRQTFVYFDMRKDVEAAVQWLTEEKDVKPQRISFVGGEYGSTLAMQALARNPELGAVVALSPSRNYFGVNIVNFVEDYGKRPLYLILSKQLQTSGADEVEQAMKDNPKFKMKVFPRSDLSGVDLLGTSWQVEKLIIEWLREVYQLGSS